MFCRNCGNKIIDGQKFCQNCGTPVQAVSVNNEVSNQQVNTNMVAVPATEPKKGNNGCLIAVIITLVVLFLLGGCSVAVIASIAKAGSEIVESYNDIDHDYDFPDDEDDYEVDDDDEIDSDDVGTAAGEVTTVIGSDEYGYVSIPTSWYKFYDIDGTTAIQYSYFNKFIVTLDAAEKTNGTTAEGVANNYYTKEKEDKTVTGVTIQTVTIGKNNEYTAYQVSVYYPDDDVYLVTYWFETGDNKIHYIAIEGPEEYNSKKLTDYTETIPKTFSMNK